MPSAGGRSCVTPHRRDLRCRAMSHRAVLTLVAASLLAAGCGTSKPTLQRPSAPTEPINADPAKPARDAVQAGLRKYPLTDPRGVVLMLWRRMQQGIPQLGMQLYEPGVVQRLVVAAVEGGLATQGSLFRAYAPVVEKPEPTKIGFLVNVTATNPGHPVVHYTFLLRRNATGGWYISYDSLLEDGLIAY